MNWHPHEGIAPGELASTVLPWVEQPHGVRALREFLSEYTHRCRNSLHGIKLSLYLFRRGFPESPPEALVLLESAYQETERLFDRLQEIYRPMRITMVRSSLGRLFAERLPLWQSWFRERGRTLEADRPAKESAGDYDPMHLGSGLDAFIAWRAEDGSACGNARLAWCVHDGFFEVDWHEVDGPEERAGVSRRNAASDHSRALHSGDSLALPLFARIVSEHGGAVKFQGNPAWHLTASWPQFHSEPRVPP